LVDQHLILLDILPVCSNVGVFVLNVHPDTMREFIIRLIGFFLLVLERLVKIPSSANAEL
jgi:hypothetical protein